MEDRKLTHLDDQGRARMVDVSRKDVTVRTARAMARVRVGRQVASLIRETGSVKKGDVLQTARLAGIMGAKRVPDLVPLAHPIGLDHVDVTAELSGEHVILHSEVTCTARTGVEMEAMTAVSVAALTVYDMCKAAARGIEIEKVTLLMKSGGRSGTWKRSEEDE